MDSITQSNQENAIDEYVMRLVKRVKKLQIAESALLKLGKDEAASIHSGHILQTRDLIVVLTILKKLLNRLDAIESSRTESRSRLPGPQVQLVRWDTGKRITESG